VAGPQLGVPVAAAKHGQLGDLAVPDLAQHDLAIGQLLAVLVVAADELADEAGRGRNGAYDRRLGAIGCVAGEPPGEGVQSL
jgi:hypothetical protein